MNQLTAAKKVSDFFRSLNRTQWRFLEIACHGTSVALIGRVMGLNYPATVRVMEALERRKARFEVNIFEAQDTDDGRDILIYVRTSVQDVMQAWQVGKFSSVESRLEGLCR